LLDLRKAIRFAPEFGMIFKRAHFIQQPPVRFVAIAVDGKGTNQYKSPHSPILQASVEQVTRSHHGIHEGIGVRFLANSGSQMIDERYTFARALAVLPGQKIAF
jgi:hypothetical protein